MKDSKALLVALSPSEKIKQAYFTTQGSLQGRCNMPEPRPAGHGKQDVITVAYMQGYAVLTMIKEPVNSMDLAMWQQLEATLEMLESNQDIHGLIITTGLKRDVFTAGNDLQELYAPRTTQARYTEFWVTSNRFLCKLYSSRLATIAAIRGACPAGGCMMSMCCDHRVISGNGGMGLNEVQLGISVPKYWGLLMARLIGQKAADKMLITGKMVSAVEAKALGLVDQVVDKGEVLSAAEAVMQQLVKLPGKAVAATKQVLREDFCKQWSGYWESEAASAWQFLTLPETLATLGGAMQRLSGRSKPASKL